MFRCLGSFGQWIGVAILIVAISSGAEANVLLRGLGSFTSSPSDEVGDNLAGSGLGMAGGLYIGLNESVFLGGQVGLAILGGQDDPVYGTDVTDNAVLFTFEAGCLIFFPVESSVRPFIGGAAGRGGLGWVYSRDVEYDMEDEADGIGFWYIAPLAGLSIGLSSSVALIGEVRGLLTSYVDETLENWKWGLGGGHFMQAHAGLSICF